MTKFRKLFGLVLVGTPLAAGCHSEDAKASNSAGPITAPPVARFTLAPGYTLAVDTPTTPRYMFKPGHTKDTLWLTIRDASGNQTFNESFNSFRCDDPNHESVCEFEPARVSAGTGYKAGVIVVGTTANSSIDVKPYVTDGFTTLHANVAVTERFLAATGVSISPTTPNVKRDSTRQFANTVSDAWGTGFGSFLFPSSYTSSNTAVGTISATGLFTAHACGTTTVTAQRTDGFTNPTSSTTVTVNSRCVASLSFVNDSGNFDVGSTRQYYINGVLDNNGASWNEKIPLASWASSNPSVVSISSNGLATSVAQGTAILSATIEGVPHTVSATVYPKLSLSIFGPRKVTLTGYCDFQATVSGGSGGGYSYWWNRDGADIGNSSSVSGVVYDDYFDIALSVKDSAGNRRVLRYWLTAATGSPTAGCYDQATTTVSGSPP